MHPVARLAAQSLQWQRNQNDPMIGTSTVAIVVPFGQRLPSDSFTVSRAKSDFTDDCRMWFFMLIYIWQSRIDNGTTGAAAATATYMVKPSSSQDCENLVEWTLSRNYDADKPVSTRGQPLLFEGS